MEMTMQRAVDLLRIEQECVNRNIVGCGRDCIKCDLVQEDSDLVEMYNFVIDYLEKELQNK